MTLTTDGETLDDRVRATNARRLRMLHSIEAHYPIDEDNQRAMTFFGGVIGEGEPALDELIPKFMLIQTHTNGRRWHEFASTVDELLRYAESDEEWAPLYIVNLDEGVAFEIATRCDLAGVKEQFLPAAADPKVQLEASIAESESQALLARDRDSSPYEVGLKVGIVEGLRLARRILVGEEVTR